MNDSVQALWYGLARADMLWRMPVTATGNAAEGIPPREHQGEGGTRLREAPGLDAALPRARHMFPQDLAAHVTAASGMLGGAERRSFGNFKV